MKKNRLGKTDIFVSKLCYGSLTIGPLQANLPYDEAAMLIKYAYSKGINFIDTAQYYENYEHIRQGIAGIEDKFVITSKTYAYDKDGAVQAVEQARKALNRDYIDIFLLHEQESEHTIRGHMQALETLYDYKAKGVIKAVGISTHRIDGVKAANKYMLDVVHPLINKNGIGIFDGTLQEMEHEIKKAHDNGIFVYAMKALGGGNLISDAKSCLEYIYSLDYVDSVAIGMKSVYEIDLNSSFFENGQFDDIKSEKISKQNRKLIIEDHCIGCGNCERRCKNGAITVDKITNKAVCNPDKCVLCGYCGAVCKEWCIKIV